MKEVIVRTKELMPIILEKIERNELAQLKVKGSSMEPFFHSDQTIVTLAKANALKRHDIILFKSENDNYILHRIIHITKDDIITMGDALRQKEVVRFDDIIAKVIDFESNEKKVSVLSRKYRFKVKLWVFFRPFRRILMKLNRMLKRSESNE
jgi:signal peptidase I